MQALESLNDSQVNDFLSGKAPLNLTMRLGDHMMLIQLQLSTISPSTSRRSTTASSISSSTSSSSTSSSSSRKSPCKVHPSSSVDIPIETAAMATATSVCSPDPAATSTLKSQTSSVLDSFSSASSLTTTSSSVPLSNVCKNVPCKCGSTTTKPLLDTRALAEASRNLTQTLKQLSSEVLTSKSDTKEESSSSACSSPNSSTPSSPTHIPSETISNIPSSSSSSSSNFAASNSATTSTSSNTSSSSSKRRQGAIIESMHHHGKGVYSGTFSGTLNPALQDKFGRPKRDISTIIHILNDLLCATPQYRAARSSASPSTSSALDMAPASISPTSSPVVKSTNDISTNTDVKMLSAGSDSLENQATRDKMERLRVIMEERRERRRAKRSAPYTCPSTMTSTQWSAKSESRDVIANESMDTESPPAITPEPVVA
ncbi:midnolin homolog [Diaphorina citri]|uniref:Midnolin homolog n=2 Tax=Diaphorina citri TaxID=121845 RepID=A0A1S3CY99_DIACI|nr:midnolin homolog [Diaphorina citri]